MYTLRTSPAGSLKQRFVCLRHSHRYYFMSEAKVRVFKAVIYIILCLWFKVRLVLDLAITECHCLSVLSKCKQEAGKTVPLFQSCS